MNGELDARYRDVSLKDAVRRVSMDMTLDGWVFMRVARECLSKIKGYPDNADNFDYVFLNAKCKKGPSFRIALFLGIGSPVAGAGQCSTLTWGCAGHRRRTVSSKQTVLLAPFGAASPLAKTGGPLRERTTAK